MQISQNIGTNYKNENNIHFMSPSAKVFPLKPRSAEMLSSGSLTTLSNERFENTGDLL